ncbi:MAG: SDR family oxidoreductase [Clostridia bacterium]|nr:SDR family oxidoreductase [Clostridia bacterium]
MKKNVIVTGVTRGIGRQIALDLVESGYYVIGIYNNSKQKAKELEEISSNIKTFKCDISDYSEVCETAKRILSEFKSIYALVNNAGVAKTGLVTDMSEEDYRKIFDTNVKGVFALTKTILPFMINEKQGKIVNISSIWGVCGGSCEVLYSASKSAIIGMTKALAKEVGPSGINVNAVAPGVILTDMLDNLSQEDLDALANDTALMRNGTPKDISNVVKFLISEDSSFITGQTITVDGGMI